MARLGAVPNPGAMSDVVEIRVHGVSGTPAEALLQVTDLRQVDGDDTARFLRRSTPPPEPPVREAFHWGNMTSGSVSKALWLLLAPFGLVNLARYTLPMAVSKEPGEEAKERRRWARVTADVALRLLGLALTLMLTATVAFVALDLVAWQCGNSTRCIADNGWLPLSDKQPTSWALRLLLAVAAPVALIALLVQFGRQVYLYPPTQVPPTEDQPADSAQKPEEWRDGVGGLAHKEFWATSPRAPMLRLFHTTGSVALLAILVAYALVEPVAGLRGGDSWADEALYALFGAAALIGLLCVALTAAGYHPKGDELKFDPTGKDAIQVPRTCRVLRWIAWGVLLAEIVIAFFFGPHYSSQATGTEPVNLNGSEWVFNVLYAATAVLLIVLLVMTLVLRPVLQADGLPKPFRPMWGGMACPALASFAVLLATGFTAGFAIQTARLLGQIVQPREDAPKDRFLLVLPDVFHVTALLWSGLVVVAVLCGFYLVFRYVVHGLGRSIKTRVRTDYLDVPAQDLPERTVSKIAKAWRRASLKYRLPDVLGCLSLLGFIFSLGQGALAGNALLPGQDEGFELVQDAFYDRVWLGVKFFGLADDVGVWALTVLAAGLVFVGMRAFRSPQWRRTVGVVWDLLAFWPRLAHPIVPPPYGGRSVLALTKRVQDKTADGGKVVLSGHSQGSVICVAAVLQVAAATLEQSGEPKRSDKPAQLSQVALLTHGSQLMWAYARLFPAYLGQPLLRDVYKTHLNRRWLNLHRWSDYIGGPVLAYPAAGRVRPELVEGWTDIDGIPHTPDPGGTGQGADVWYRAVGPEIQLRDPHRIVAVDGRPVAPLLAHSSYYADPAYDAAVQELVRQIGLGRLRWWSLRRLRWWSGS